MGMAQAPKATVLDHLCWAGRPTGGMHPTP